MSALIRSASFVRISAVMLDFRITDVQKHLKHQNVFSELSFAIQKLQNRTQIIHQEWNRIFDVTKYINCSRIRQVSAEFHSGDIEEIYKTCFCRISEISEISSIVDSEKFKIPLELTSVKPEDIKTILKGLKLSSPILRDEKQDDASQYIQEKYQNSKSLPLMNNVLAVEELCYDEGDKVAKNCISLNNYSGTFDGNSETAITFGNGKPEITSPGDTEVTPPDEHPEFIPPDKDPEFIPPYYEPEYIPPDEDPDYIPPDEDPVCIPPVEDPEFITFPEEDSEVTFGNGEPKVVFGDKIQKVIQIGPM